MIRAFIHHLGALRRNRQGSVTVEYAMLLLPALMPPSRSVEQFLDGLRREARQLGGRLAPAMA